MSRTPTWEATYREFFVARQRPLMRTAYAILGSWAAAEDAVQTTFARLYVHWPRIQAGAVDTYARRTLVRVCFRMSTTGVLAVSGAAAVAGVGLTGGPDGPAVAHEAPPLAVQPATAPAPAPDWVPGTDTDQDMAATIAAAVPHLPDPEDVYPSDGNTAGALPDTAWPGAQDWQAYYTIDDTQLIVMMAVPNETPDDPFSCNDVAGQSYGIRSDLGGEILTSGPTGTLCTQTSGVNDGEDTLHGTWYERADGSIVAVLETFPNGQPRPLLQSEANQIAQDPSLVCPPPSA